MNANTQTVVMQDRKAVLSTLWVSLSAGYIYRDVLSNMEPTAIKELMAGAIGSIRVTQGFLLAAALMMQIPFAMIVLSRVLKYRANRWANIVAGAFMIVVEVGTMGTGTPPTLHYLFYSAIVIAGNLAIAWYAWHWRNAEFIGGVK